MSIDERSVWISAYKDGVFAGTLYFDEVDTRVQEKVAEFTALGIAKGDRVIVKMKNSINAILTYLALYKMEATAVPVHFNERGPRLNFVIVDTGASTILSDDGFKLLDTPPVENTLGTHIDTIIYTSGTTGTPKGVCLTLQNWDAGADAIIEHHAFTKETVYATAMPLFHCNAHGVAIFATLKAKAKLILSDNADASFLEIATNEHATVIGAVPIMVHRWHDAVPYFKASSALRYIVVAGSALHADLLTVVLHDWNIQVIQGYGQTETTHYSTTMPLTFSNEAYGAFMKDEPSIGIALPGFEIRIEGDDRENSLGELYVKSRANSIGYWGMEPQTDEWIASGDVGVYRLHEGKKYFYIKGRVKELINKGSNKYSPAEIENEVRSLGFSNEYAVIGIPDDMMDEEIALVCTNQEDAPRARQFPKYIFPKKIFVMDELLRTATGKLKRSEMTKYVLAHPECEVVL